MPAHSIYTRLLAQLEKNERSVYAVLIDALGSTPQVAGAAALFGPTGLLTGSVGGGVLEEEAGRIAAIGLRDRISRLRRFALNEGEKSDHGAVCGGEAVLLLDADPAVHAPVFRDLQHSLSQRRGGVLLTRILPAAADKVFITRTWWEEKEGSIPWQSMPFGALNTLIAKVFSRGQPELLSFAEFSSEKKSKEKVFVEPLFPRQRLVIVGAGHIGQALSHWGQRLGFEITVIDDRPEYANITRLPDADNIIVATINEALRAFPIASDTYIVIVTRGHQHDEAALRECIRSSAAYIGMIGSRNKVKLARDRFIREGWASVEQWERIFAPIGLDIDSKTVEEIAVSIAAQLVQQRRQILSNREPIE